MMMFRNKKIIIIIIATFAMITGYNNCSPLKSAVSGSGSANDRNGDGFGDNQAEAPAGNGDIVPLSDTRTASIVRANRVLDNMVSCLGTGTPGVAAKAAWNEQRAGFSTEGDANSITSTMFVGFETVASEVCNDLVQQERALGANQRRIFNQIDFNAGQNAVGNGQIADVTRRIARACWGRNETSEELGMIQQGTNQAFNGAQNNNQQTVNKVIFICTSMVNSFAAVGM
jgi:hypothetical protein